MKLPLTIWHTIGEWIRFTWPENVVIAEDGKPIIPVSVLKNDHVCAFLNKEKTCITPFLLYSPNIRHCPVFNDLEGDPYVADLIVDQPPARGLRCP